MRNGYPITKAKVEFTDYTVAGTNIGRFKAALLKEVYAIDRADIEINRMTKLQVRPKPDARCGYPTKRERNEDIPSKRGVPHSKFLKRFKIVDRIAWSQHLAEFIYSAKIYVLHATRGWKFYA